MNILDENVPEHQRLLLQRKRISFRQLGYELGRLGMKDDEIITLLHQLPRPTLFTLDDGFFRRRLCHPSYCLVYLHIGEEQVADYVRRVLRHRALNTKAARMGRVIQASLSGLRVWSLDHDHRQVLSWE